MKANVNITLALLAITSLWAVLYYPVGYIVLTGAAAAAAYAATGDYTAPLGVVIFMILLRTLGAILKPAPADPVGYSREGFQAKDPITIHQRIVKEKVAAPPVNTVTGVLESPNILGNLHVSQVNASEEGFTNSTQPAPNSMSAPAIPTPAESSVPQPTSTDAGVRMNPALIGGEDQASVETAMTNKGSALYAPAAADGAATGGSGPAPFN
jgi:hypothetical protein